jgi:hypothetical protein
MRPATLLLTLLPLTLASPVSEQAPPPDWAYLSTLLDRIDNTVLHGVLHQLSPKYKDGVFHHDRHAIEHVHSTAPIMATKLVHLALKRQDNGTVPDSTTTTTSQQTTTQQTTTSAPPPPPTTSSSSTPTPDPTQEASISSALSEDITAETTPDPTTIAVAPTTPPDATPVTTVVGGVVFSTVGGGLVTETSRNVDVSFTRSSSTKVVLSTAADGRVETLTSVVVVNAPVTGSPDSGAQGAAATSGQPGLQDGAVAQPVQAVLLVVAALLAGAAAVVL